jgi:hypothetical protein
MHPRGTSKSTGYYSCVEVSENQRDSSAKKHENRALNRSIGKIVLTSIDIV